MTGAAYKDGKSRKIQLECMTENCFPRYFGMEKVGRGKYQVTEIYDEPLDVVDNRDKGGSSVYLKYIELILLKYLTQKYGNKARFSRSKLWQLLGMVNTKYGVIDFKELRKKNENFTNFEINNFYFRASNKLSRILKSALDNLEKRRLITYTQIYVLVKTVRGKERHIKASDTEVEYITKLEHDTLNKFGYNSLADVKVNRKQEAFYDVINSKVYEDNKWKYYYKAYNIIFDHENIEKFIPRLELSLEEALKGLNSEIILYLNNEAELMFKNNKERINKKIKEAKTLEEFNDARKSFTYPNKYIIAQKLLAKELIDITGNDEEICDDSSDSTATDEAIMSEDLNKLFNIETL